MSSDAVPPDFNPFRPEPGVFEQEVLSELIKLHAQVLKRMPLVQLMLASGVGLLFFYSIPPVTLLCWTGLTVSIECLRAFFAIKILNPRTVFQPRTVHKQLVILAAISGAAIGLGAVLFLPGIPLPDQAMLVIILFTMPAAGVSVSVSSRQILAAYSLFILVPTSFSWVMLYPDHLLTATGLTLLYWGFIICVAADGEQLLRRSVGIRCELDRVVKNLEQRNTEVRAAVTLAEHSSQARARILATASHDLRQPLHALSVYSAVLAANPAPEMLPEVASNIDRLVRSLGTLLHGLLDLSHLSAEYYVPEKKLMSLGKVIEDVCNEYTASIAEKQLHLMRNFEPVYLCDDPVAIARIARNLLDNAVKYTDKGEIRVQIRIYANTAQLVIEDTGKGIALEEQHRVFEEFYQLDNPGRDFSKGVGLGLAIVQRLCELIRAHIMLISQPGSGSRFVVTFHSLASNKSDPKTFAAIKSPDLQGTRIYIVDDEPDILNSTKALLQTWHVAVETAHSSATTEKLFAQFGIPDLLIVDLRLNEQTHGAELARHLQQIYGEFPVLVITGETASEALLKTNKKGYPLLQKPITPELLSDTICTILKTNKPKTLPDFF